jgi:arylsulfatase A-like enzyme
MLAASASPQSGPDAGVLVVVLDDVGAEHLSFHPIGVEAGAPAPTPTLDMLAATGIQFTNAWVTPVCSATRAALLTGRYGHRTGIGAVVDINATYELPLAEATLAERMRAHGHSTAFFGKWHVSNAPEDPCDQGFQLWDGNQRNVGDIGCVGCTYTNWTRTLDTDTGSATSWQETGYATTVVADAALAWIQTEQAASRPWFSVVAFNAVHKPRHAPPLHLQPVTGAIPSDDDLTLHRGMIEALDTELGRMLAGIDLTRTTVFVIGDNGSDTEVTLPPVRRAKGSVRRGGIEVPFIVAGQYVDRAVNAGENFPGEQIDGHVHVVDVFHTSLLLLRATGGGPWPLLDSKNIYRSGRWQAVRGWNFTERVKPLGAPPGGPYTFLRRAAEKDGWKLILNEVGAAEMFDVVNDPWEHVDVLEDGIDPAEQAIVNVLMKRIATLGL